MIGAAYLLEAGRNLAATGQANCLNGDSCDTGLPVVRADSAQIGHLTAIFFGIIAAVAVLMIVLAGLRFITGQGNPQEVAKARNTILFALIGLVVALIAEAIVALVLNKLP